MKTNQLKKSLFYLCLICMASISYAQEANHKKTITHQLNTFFKGLNTKDTTMIKPTLANQVSMKTLLVKEDREELVVDEINDFLQQIGRLGTLHIEERISNLSLNVYYPLATALMEYEFFVDGELSHIGINLFEFAYIDKQWKIIGISDTRQ